MNIDPIPQLTQADIDAINAAAEVLRTKAPWRKGLTGAQTKKLFKLGDNSVGFVQKALDEARAHPGVLAGDFSVADMGKRLTFLEALDGLLAEINPLTEQLNDTATLIGADVLQDALDVYDSMKRALKKKPELEDAVRELGTRFAKTKAAKAKPAT